MFSGLLTASHLSSKRALICSLWMLIQCWFALSLADLCSWHPRQWKHTHREVSEAPMESPVIHFFSQKHSVLVLCIIQLITSHQGRTKLWGLYLLMLAIDCRTFLKGFCMSSGMAFRTAHSATHTLHWGCNNHRKWLMKETKGVSTRRTKGGLRSAKSV